ncbi:MAG: HTH domain-containing protein [Bacillota bacterium]
MGRKIFTPEEIAELRTNKYVCYVSATRLCFVAEFKQKFSEEYNSGKLPRHIVAGMGIDPDIIGESRLDSIRTHVKQQAQSGYGFSDGFQRRPQTSGPVDSSLPLNKRVAHLEHELIYTKQEMEFIKKTILAEIEVQRKCSSKKSPKSNL